jgi:tight adherence protein C
VTAVLALGWATFVAAGAWLARPIPARALGPRPPSSPHAPVVSAARPGVLERIGALLLRCLRPGTPPDPARARRLGTAALAGLLPLPVLPVAAIPFAVLAWCLPPVAARGRRRRRMAAIERELPEVVDLLLLAVGAGLSVRQAVDAVARRSHGQLAAELGRVGADVARGRRLGDALDDLPARAGEAVRPLVSALVAADRYGAPLGPGLERLADEVRSTCRRRAEATARRVPVKLLFPLVACILPAFALLTVAPLIAGALKTLRLP